MERIEEEWVLSLEWNSKAITDIEIGENWDKEVTGGKRGEGGGNQLGWLPKRVRKSVP